MICDGCSLEEPSDEYGEYGVDGWYCQTCVDTGDFEIELYGGEEEP